MLKTLDISNYALINQLSIQVNEGFSVITGETGSGKSIILGALAMIMGKRADSSVVKDPNKKCVIEAVFDLSKYKLEDFFNQHDLDYSAQTIIRREVMSSGKSRAFINDTPVVLEVLQQLNDYLIDVHSQHQTLGLLSLEAQFYFLDSYANNLDLLSEYKKQYQDYLNKQKSLQTLQAQLATVLQQKDYQIFMLNELLEANLQDVNLPELEEELLALENAELILEQLNASTQLMNDETMGIQHQLKLINQSLSKISVFSDKYAQLLERLNSVIIETTDIDYDIQKHVETISLDPNRLLILQQKSQQLNRLMQKHQVNSTEELLMIQNKLVEENQDSETLEQNINLLKNDLKTIELDLWHRAEALHQNRLDYCDKLTKKLEELLFDLGMQQTKFDLKLSKNQKLNQSGCSQLAFMVTTNQGMPFTELKKVASGGELSRIMLSMKSILAQHTKLPTIIFDEIDTGVSGDIAQKMAQMMLEMSRNMQVISITHLPQIAAKGQTHYKVQKTTQNNETATELFELSPQDRLNEIAQMISGAQISETAISHAKSLLAI